MAEAFAAKCAAKHVTNKNSSFDSIGRNFYLLSNTDLDKQVDYSVAITAWFSELSDYDYENASCKSSCANYTQVCYIRARNMEHPYCPVFDIFIFP